MFARRFHIIFAIVFVAGSNFVLQPMAFLPFGVGDLLVSSVSAQSTSSGRDPERAYANGLAAMQAGEPRKAQAIWSVLALQGSAKAQYSLALLLETGQGPVEPNIKQAIRFYAMAADAGIAEAQTNLGLLYAQGRGVNANPALAVKYWQKSASAGHAMALFNLGLAYYQGTGTQQDSEEAVALIYRAAMQNLKEAQYALGQFYRNGVGTPKSEEEALYWYRIAGRQGHPDAAAAAKELKAKGIKFRGAPDPTLKPREAAVFAVAANDAPRAAETQLQKMIAPAKEPATDTSSAMTVTVEDPVEDPIKEPVQNSTSSTIPTLPPVTDDVATLPVMDDTPQKPLVQTRPVTRKVMMLTESEAEITYREALVLMQNHDGDRINNGQIAADKILSAAVAGNARAQRSLGEMYLLGLDIRRNEQQSLYWLREAERNGIDDINGFADALELLGYSEPVRPSANPQFASQ